MSLPSLHVFAEAASIKEIGRELKAQTSNLIDFAETYYGAKKLKIGDMIAGLMNFRYSFGEYAPYVDDIKDTSEIFHGRLGIKTLQHSVSLGCTTLVRNAHETPSLMGTVDWEQVGNDLSSVVFLAVLENPIHPEAPVASVAIGPAAFGLIMMNSHASVKLNRAPIPNVKDKDIDLSAITDAEYREVKKRNNNNYTLKTAFNAIVKGRPPAAYLIRHAINKNMTFEDTVDYIKKTPTCDFAIITVAGTKAGQAVTIEKRAGESYAYSGYEAAANHWTQEGDFGKKPSLPRTLNSSLRAAAITDETRPALYKGDHFSFANGGVVDHTTRIMVETNVASGKMTLVTTHGRIPTSKAVSARFDGQKLCDIEHFNLEMA